MSLTIVVLLLHEVISAVYSYKLPILLSHRKDILSLRSTSSKQTFNQFDWTPSTWANFPIKQPPNYPNKVSICIIKKYLQ